LYAMLRIPVFLIIKTFSLIIVQACW
jgi:hypothetical protein